MKSVRICIGHHRGRAKPVPFAVHGLSDWILQHAGNHMTCSMVLLPLTLLFCGANADLYLQNYTRNQTIRL